MPYFARHDSSYWCRNCKAWFEVPDVHRACLVLHPPGDCCHVGETRVVTYAEVDQPQCPHRFLRGVGEPLLFCLLPMGHEGDHIR